MCNKIPKTHNKKVQSYTETDNLAADVKVKKTVYMQRLLGEQLVHSTFPENFSIPPLAL